MSVGGWGVWSERECRPARRAGGTPVQEPGGAPAKPRTPLAHGPSERRSDRASGVWVAAGLAGVRAAHDCQTAGDPRAPDIALIQLEPLKKLEQNQHAHSVR